METNKETVTIKSLTFFGSMIGFGIGLVISINTMIKSAVDKGVSDALEKVGLKIEINKAEQRIVDHEQDSKIQNFDKRIFALESK